MKKVLICDDEQDIRDVLQILLEIEFEVEIIQASDGREGIEYLKQHNDLCLIVCDMNMPHSKGSDVYNFNRKYKDLPFILLSGDGDQDILELEDFQSNKKYRHLNKPWRDNELYETLEGFLNKKAA